MTTATFLQHLVRQLRHTTEAPLSDHPSDADLLRRFQQHRDPHALEAIVRRYGNCVLSACRKILTAEADVEDAFQATFVVLLQNANSIRRGQALGGWLSCVAHRVALKALTNAMRRKCVEQQRQSAASEAPDLSWREACAILHEELDKLPDQYRRPLILCYLDGKSRDEAAQQLGVTTDALRGRLDRGRERLRGRLLKRGIALSAGLLAAMASSVTARGLPEHLLRATLTAATTGQLPASVAALLRGTAPAMTLGKFKLLAVAVLVFGLFSGGVGLCMLSAPPAMEAPRQANLTQPAKAPHTVAEPEKVLDPNHKAVAVSGKVVGPDGKPVAKAKLFVMDSEEAKPAPQAETRHDGEFTFELPPLQGGHTWRYVVATAPDLGLGCDWVGAPAMTTSLKGVVLKLPKDEPIKGRVVDLEGKAVAGAQVRVTDLETGKDDTLDEFIRLWSNDHKQQQEAISALGHKRLYARKATAEHFAATTDADGRFTLTGLGRDRCPRLTIRAKGKATQLCFVALRPDFKPDLRAVTGSFVFGPEFTLPLAPSTVITGVVRDAESRKPLAGVCVRGQVDLNDALLRGFLILPDVEAVTDAEGRYTLDGLPKGKKYILAASPKPGDGPVHGFASRRDETPGGALTADFDLPRGVVLAGQIKDKKTGQPLRGYVFYRPLASNGWEDKHPIYGNPGVAPWAGDASVWTDVEGRFKLTAIPGPGILHVQVFTDHPQYPFAKLAREDDTNEIMAKATPLPDTFNTHGQGGHFGPSNLNAYRVLRIPDDAKTHTVDVELEPRNEDRKPDEELTYAGRILDPDGRALAGAKVYICGLNASVFEFVPRTTSGKDGLFRFTVKQSEFQMRADQPEQKPGDRVFIGATATGYGATAVWCAKSEQRDKLTLWLPAEQVVKGRILDLEGKAIAGVRVDTSMNYGLSDADGHPLPYDAELKQTYFPVTLVPQDPESKPVVSDQDGRFTIHGLGKDWCYNLRITGPTIEQRSAQLVTRPQKPMQVTGLGTVTAEGGMPKLVQYGCEFDHVAGPSKPIVGVVRDKETGKPIAGVRVGKPWRRDDEAWSWATTDREGRYRLEGLPWAVHELTVEPPKDTPHLRTTVRAAADKPDTTPAQCDIELRRRRDD